MNQLLIENIILFLKKEFQTDDRRLKHIFSVEKMAIELGKIYNIDIHKLRIAALLHDSTKLLTHSENYNLALKRFSKSEINLVPKSCLHAYAASQLAVEKFNISDIDILNAIAYHCSGKKAMSKLQQIIYISDYIEETRAFTNDNLKKLAKQSLDKTTYEILYKTIQYLELNNRHISKLSQEALEYYKTKMEGINER
ncbi:MAG: bis(5'-nucleosyl)-tetraphosphatase (symmetrical) YqeK [Candidatus Izimaplasma sp.]|nr:bis(5'-nucleosyl)-tetraphosphatase (symmetrical) YqeK [Candidatus Izimaplasma bacterium]